MSTVFGKHNSAVLSYALTAILASCVCVPSCLCVQAARLFPTIHEVRLKSGLRVLSIPVAKQSHTAFLLQFGNGSIMDAFAKPEAHALAVHLLAEYMNARLATTTTVRLFPDALTISWIADHHTLPQQLILLHDILTQLQQIPYTRLPNIQQQMQQNKASPLQIMASRIVYGTEHPYTRWITMEQIHHIAERDAYTSLQTLCTPHNTTLYIAGTLQPQMMSELLKSSLGLWNTGTEQPYYPRPRLFPQEHAVHAIEVPSHLLIQHSWAPDASTLVHHVALVFDAPARNDMDYDALMIHAHALERNLRVVLPSQSRVRVYMMSAQRYSNIMAIECELQDALAIPRYIDQVRTVLRRTLAAPLTRLELQLGKQYLQQNFISRTDSVHNLVLLIAEAERCNLTLKDLRSFSQRITRLSAEAVHLAAQRYFQPERGILLLSDSASVASLMPSLRTLGTVHRYTPDGQTIVQFDSSDISLATLLERHIQALGGTAATARITALLTTTEVQLSAMAQQFPGTLITKQKVPGKILRKLEIPATQIVQELWCDGQTAFDKIEMLGQEYPLRQRSQAGIESALFDAQIFPALTMGICGFTPELLGKRDGNYIVRASTPHGTIKTLTFDGSTYLLRSIEELRQTPQGILQAKQEFRAYEEFEGVKLPTTVLLRTNAGTLIGKNSYNINPLLDDSIFHP